MCSSSLGQDVFLRHRLGYDVQLALDAAGRVRSAQLRVSESVAHAAAGEWSPRLLLAPAHDAPAIPPVLIGIKGVPYAGQAEVSERQVAAAAAAAAAASAGGIHDDAEAAAAAAAAAQAAAAQEQAAAAAPESFFQKCVGARPPARSPAAAPHPPSPPPPPSRAGTGCTSSLACSRTCSCLGAGGVSSAGEAAEVGAGAAGGARGACRCSLPGSAGGFCELAGGRV